MNQKYIMLLMAEECGEINEANLLNSLANICDETRDLIAVTMFFNNHKNTKDQNIMIPLVYNVNDDWKPAQNMLNHIDILYPLIVNSIQHMIFKCLRFGLNSKGPDKGFDNINELINLFSTLVVYINVMNYKHPGFHEQVYNSEKILEKHNKVLSFYTNTNTEPNNDEIYSL